MQEIWDHQQPMPEDSPWAKNSQVRGIWKGLERG
jgi:hypothetical protein